ncbi:hypothetical protein M413DRAFT_424128 [Hebeloma cylindrosporum]|uniref:Uncharacterized protein n=1 Tax=Hebeloma cylindrosporum TaxID=76867 RepID=A0A0C3BXE7_HEBCY|nr:hypothetical protein M413DRAFT_424128 [Hebeloma cylindrosporum h7]
MRSFFSLSLIAVAAFVRLASAVENNCLSEICYDTTDISPRDEPTPTAFTPKRLTNGERLALGLPPNPPSRRRRGGFAARAEPSPTPKKTLTGVIEVKSAAGSLGFVSRDTFVNGQFKWDPIASAVMFSIEVEEGATSASDINVSMNVSTRTLPDHSLAWCKAETMLVSILHLVPSSMGSPGTPPNSPPASIPNIYTTATGLSRAAESSVWHVDLITGEMTVQWTNSDSSTPFTEIFSQSGYLYAGADSHAFFVRYPAPVTPINRPTGAPGTISHS